MDSRGLLFVERSLTAGREEEQADNSKWGSKGLKPQSLFLPCVRHNQIDLRSVFGGKGTGDLVCGELSTSRWCWLYRKEGGVCCSRRDGPCNDGFKEWNNVSPLQSCANWYWEIWCLDFIKSQCQREWIFSITTSKIDSRAGIRFRIFTFKKKFNPIRQTKLKGQSKSSKRPGIKCITWKPTLRNCWPTC